MSGVRLALSEVEVSISDMVSPRGSIDRNHKEVKALCHRCEQLRVQVCCGQKSGLAAELRSLLECIGKLDQRWFLPGLCKERNAYRQAKDKTGGHSDMRIPRHCGWRGALHIPVM